MSDSEGFLSRIYRILANVSHGQPNRKNALDAIFILRQVVFRFSHDKRAAINNSAG